jgi:hypothetical protein
MFLSSYRVDALLTGPAEVVISYHSRDIGVDCLLFYNHYKDHGRAYVQYYGLEWYPVCVDQFDKAAVCDSGGQAFESTSHIL